MGTTMTKAPVTEVGRLGGENVDLFRQTLEKWAPQFQSALGKGFEVGHFLEVATTAYLDPKNKLQQCEPMSIMRALLRCAQMRLRPDGKECAIIPRGQLANAEPMFQGLVRTMLRTGTVKKVEARVVQHGDLFEYHYGLDPKLVHRPAPSLDQGGTCFAYAIVWLTNGERQFEVMDRDELDKVRRLAKETNNGKLGPAWTNFEDEMFRKIVVKRLAKYIEQNAELAAVVAFDNALETGEALDLRDVLPEIEDRSLEERAEQHATRRTEELRQAIAQQRPQEPSRGDQRDGEGVGDGEAVQGAQIVPSSLDVMLTWGKYKGTSLRALLEAGGGKRGYVTHFMLGEKCTQLDDDDKARLKAAIVEWDATQEARAQEGGDEAGEDQEPRQRGGGEVPPPPSPWGE